MRLADQRLELQPGGSSLKLGQRLGLDLADSLARNRQLLPISFSVRVFGESMPNRSRSTSC
jgi:hypothetical protein